MTGAGDAFVLFEVDGRVCAAAARCVHRIVEPPPVAAIPFAPAAVEGLVAIGGSILPLVDFGAWLDGRAALRGQRRNVGEVLELDTGAGRLAIRVSRVLSLVAAGGLGDPNAPAWEGRSVIVVDAESIDLGAPVATESDAGPGAIGDVEAPVAPPEPRTDPFVVIAIGSERYALPILAVREVVVSGAIWPMPGSPPALLGLGYLRDVSIAVLSLATLLGHPPSGGGAMVVLTRDNGRMALQVDRVLGVRRFRLRGESSQGYVDDDGTVIVPLDTDRIIPEAILHRFRSSADEASAFVPAATRQLVTFMAAGEVCALPIEEVDRAVEYRATTRVPRDGPGFDEAIEVAGTVVPVIDLRAQLRPARAAGPPTACLVTRVGKVGYAFAIDRLDRLATVPIQEIEDIDEGDGPVIGVGRLSGQPFWLLSARQLVSHAGAEVSS